MIQRWLSICGCLVSVAGIGLGFAHLQAFDTTPGAAAHPPAASPFAFTGSSHLTRRPVLLLFAHPECPCTRASLDDLALLMTQAAGRVSAHVVFALPNGDTKKWLPSGLWRQASAIPGVSVISDPNGTLTRRFGCATSGQVLLYGTDGRLLFQGGITAARGHDGDNQGSRAILQVLDGSRQPAQVTPVFGCPLFTATADKANNTSALCRMKAGNQ